MEITKSRCDFCNTEFEESEGIYLELKKIELPIHYPNVLYNLYLDFCDKKCLKNWLDKIEYYMNIDYEERLAEMKAKKVK